MSEVTVVIPTYNRHARLARTLRSLVGQSVQGFRVIVVDDCSATPVERTLPSDLREQLDTTVLRTPRNGGPALARNLAVRAATTEYIAFIDDDVDADPAWLERLVGAAEGRQPCVVIGPLLAPPDWRPTPWNLWEARTLAREYAAMQAGEYAPTWRQFFTGNALVRRADILAAGGFDERFTRAEDIELGLRLRRLGCTFVFEPEAKGWHYAHRTLASWLRIPRQYGHFEVALDGLYPDLNWLAQVRLEASYRPRYARLARRLGEHRLARRVMVGAGVASARALFAVGLAGPSMRPLSLAYDIEYHASLRESLASGDSMPGPLQPRGNPASTGPQPSGPKVVESPER